MSRPFNLVIADINGGKFVMELDEAMADAVGSVLATGKKAEITVKLVLKKSKGHEKVINIEHDFKAKIPEFDRPVDAFFVVGGNGLVTENPEQGKLPLKGVEKQAGEIKKVG